MGQLCCKCCYTKQAAEADVGGAAEGHDNSPVDSFDASLIPSAVPPATDSPVKQIHEDNTIIVSSHKPPSPVIKSPEATIAPEAESSTSKPVAKPKELKSPEVGSLVSRSPVAESPVVKSPARQHTPGSGSHKEYLNFPILQDVNTIDYIHKSKVLVIMKGLPGSGKSCIAKSLKQMYKDAVVCSADYYFMRNGEYQFNAEELTLAHKSCQESALQAAVDGAPVIIIDNTNLRAWNYKYYLGLSKGHHYTPLILEPQTPWAKDTKKLAKRNSHCVKKDILDQKLKTYEPALPVYYWWFLNEADSAQIISMAQEWLRKALKVTAFFQDFSKFSNLSRIKDMLNYYKKNEDQYDYKVLHATACVSRRGKEKNAKEYIAREAVKDSLGKCFTLQLIGFVMTSRTFGVRLRLDQDALELWGMDDFETEADTDDGKSSKQPEKKERVTLANTAVRSDSCQTTLRDGPSQLHKDRFCPTAGKGSRAHLTLGCAPRVSAKTTGFDLFKVVSQEQKIVKSKNLQQSGAKMQTFSISGGELRTYGNGVWVIYPEKEIHVNSLFSGFY